MSLSSISNRNAVFHSLTNLSAVKHRICRLLERTPSGLTRHEIAEALGMQLSSVCGRVNELEHCDPPLVVSTKETRKTDVGNKPATVVRLVYDDRPTQQTLF